MTPLQAAQQEAAWKTRVLNQVTEERDEALRQLGQRHKLSTTLRETFARMIAAFADVDFDAEDCDRDEVFSLADTLIAVLHQHIPTADVSPRTAVMRDVLDEMRRQDAKWGEQNHLNGTGDAYRQQEAELAKAQYEAASAAGVLTWRHVLNEEVREAFAESDTKNLRAELVQVAGVAMQWVAAIDRREAAQS